MGMNSFCRIEQSFVLYARSFDFCASKLNTLNRIFLPRFGCAASRIIRGPCSLRQIQKLYQVLLGSGPVDGDTLTFIFRYFVY
jgi:hypothetical protein